MVEAAIASIFQRQVRRQEQTPVLRCCHSTQGEQDCYSGRETVPSLGRGKHGPDCDQLLKHCSVEPIKSFHLIILSILTTFCSSYISLETVSYKLESNCVTGELFARLSKRILGE